MFLYVQLVALSILLVYAGIWCISDTAVAQVQGIELLPGTIMNFKDPGALVVAYDVDGKSYVEQFARDNIPFTQKEIRIRYLEFAPTITRIDSFRNVWLIPILFYGLWFVITGLLLLTNNNIFSKHTYFETMGGYPWIKMHEYFPYQSNEDDESFFRFKFHRRPGKPVTRKID